nr:golgin subfamily A member 6-like protein 7 [Dasypus novemcinctus]
MSDATFVQSSGTAPHIHIGHGETKGLTLTCTSMGWYPEPEVQWRDLRGQRLAPDSETKTPERNGVFHVETSIMLDKSSKENVACYMRNPVLGVEKEVHISVTGEFLQDQHPEVLLLIEKVPLRSSMEIINKNEERIGKNEGEITWNDNLIQKNEDRIKRNEGEITWNEDRIKRNEREIKWNEDRIKRNEEIINKNEERIEKNEQKVTQNEEIEKKNEELRTENEDLKKDNEEFKKDKEQFEKDNEEFEKDNEELKKDNEQLKTDNEELKKDNVNLKTDIDEIKKMNKEIKQKNAELTRICKKFAEELDQRRLLREEGLNEV